MTPLAFAKRVRKYTKQNTISLPDADIIELADPIKNEIAAMVAKRDIKGNYFMASYVLNNDGNGARTIYLPFLGSNVNILLANILNHIYSVDVWLGQVDADQNDIYVRALPDDFRKWDVALTETNIQARYNNAFPKYMIYGQSLYILSSAIPDNISANIRMRSFPTDLAELNDLTDDTTDLATDGSPNINSVDNSDLAQTFGIPIQIQELIARKCSIVWKGEHPGAVPATALEARYDIDLEVALSGMSENDLSGETLGKIPRDTGFEY